MINAAASGAERGGRRTARGPLASDEASALKYLLLCPRQRKAVAVGVEAGDAGLLRGASEAAALPHLSISQHWQGFVDHSVAVADARAVPFDAS